VGTVIRTRGPLCITKRTPRFSYGEKSLDFRKLESPAQSVGGGSNPPSRTNSLLVLRSWHKRAGHVFCLRIGRGDCVGL
jgi:hypothetical protein